MKRTILCFCFLVLGGSIFSLDVAGTRWGPEKRGFGYYLDFKAEKNFEYVYSGEGGGQNVKGTYIQEGNEITLTTTIINEWGELPAYIKQTKIKCKIEATNSLFSKYKLIGNGGLELWSLTHEPKNGEKRMIDGIAIYKYLTESRVTDNARVREGPGLQYKYYSFHYYQEYPNNEYLSLDDVAPKGIYLKIFGRSENKTEINGKEAYWYYCRFENNVYDVQYGWIWGGLIDIRP